jgi:hypothetical protein
VSRRAARHEARAIAEQRAPAKKDLSSQAMCDMGMIVVFDAWVARVVWWPLTHLRPRISSAAQTNF